MAGFTRDAFVADCVAASRHRDGQSAVREVLSRAVADHGAVLRVLAPPARAGLDVLHRSATLTIFSATWAPRMHLPAHDHRLWALIGLYSGREDNLLWRRRGAGIESTGGRALLPGDVATLPADAIHSVSNPLERYTAGIHVYGGDFFATPRSQWDDETLVEQPSDGEVIRALFERENARRGDDCGSRP